MKGLLLLTLLFIFLFRRPLVRNWRLTIPAALALVGGVFFVGLIASLGSAMVPGVGVLFVFLLGIALTFSILRGLFK